MSSAFLNCAVLMYAARTPALTKLESAQFQSYAVTRLKGGNSRPLGKLSEEQNGYET